MIDCLGIPSPDSSKKRGGKSFSRCNIIGRIITISVRLPSGRVVKASRPIAGGELHLIKYPRRIACCDAAVVLDSSTESHSALRAQDIVAEHASPNIRDAIS